MLSQQVELVIAGSVDHGKSTLIGRLLCDTESLPLAQAEEVCRRLTVGGDRQALAHVMDHFAEERSGSMTIDTATTFFRHGDRQYVVIDAPGHKEFTRNTITGASRASAAVFLLDVCEGLTEQTHRHAMLLRLLGIRQVIVVINKMDQMDYRQAAFDDMAARIGSLLGKLELPVLAVVPLSALEGENVTRPSGNMPWYEGPCLVDSLELLANTPTMDALPLRLPIQGVYRDGDRPVSVGRLSSGRLEVGQQVTVYPSGRRATVAGIHKFGESPDTVCAGTSIGVSLEDQDPPRRGAVLAPQNDGPTCGPRFEATTLWLTPEPLVRGQGIIVRLATQETRCRVAAIHERINSGTLERLPGESEQLCETEIAQVVLRAESPLCWDSFNRIPDMGRLVLVSDDGEVAGGAVLV